LFKLRDACPADLFIRVLGASPQICITKTKDQCKIQKYKSSRLVRSNHNCGVCSEEVLRSWAAGLLHLHVWIVTPRQLLKEPATLLQDRVRTHRIAIASANRSMRADARVDTGIAVSGRRLAHIAHAGGAPIKTRNGDVEMW